jgi:hypothetical protein
VSELRELPGLTRYARAFVYALSAAAFVWPLSLPSSALGAALLAFAGAAFVAPHLTRSRLRSPWLLVAGVLAGALAHAVVSLVGRSLGLASALGDASFLALRDALDFGLLALCAAATLTAVSQRVRWFAFVEVALCGIPRSSSTRWAACPRCSWRWC